jgi:hypothetical protein
LTRGIISGKTYNDKKILKNNKKGIDKGGRDVI